MNVIFEMNSFYLKTVVHIIVLVFIVNIPVRNVFMVHVIGV
jgi:hypothetical protein